MINNEPEPFRVWVQFRSLYGVCCVIYVIGEVVFVVLVLVCGFFPLNKMESREVQATRFVFEIYD